MISSVKSLSTQKEYSVFVDYTLPKTKKEFQMVFSRISECHYDASDWHLHYRCAGMSTKPRELKLVLLRFAQDIPRYHEVLREMLLCGLRPAIRQEGFAFATSNNTFKKEIKFCCLGSHTYIEYRFMHARSEVECFSTYLIGKRKKELYISDGYEEESFKDCLFLAVRE